MIMILQQKLSLLFFICIISFVNAVDRCEETCGTENLAKRFSYPFGFSSGCPIQLNCTEGTETVKIGEFEVENVTADSIFVNLPAKCEREITSLSPLFGDSYGMTRQNSLLFQNCSAPRNSCLIPMKLVEQRFNLSNCGVNSDDIRCYYSGSNTGLMRYSDLKQSGCQFLFSSLAFNSGEKTSVSLEFERVELEWWLHGNCSCSENANCHNFTANGKHVHRCRCKEGFEGDGFKHGTGCRKSESN